MNSVRIFKEFIRSQRNYDYSNEKTLILGNDFIFISFKLISYHIMLLFNY